MWHRPLGAVEWAPDGEGFLFMRTIQAATSNADIWWAAVDGTPQPFIVTESNERNPRFSPNDRWVAYVSDQTGAPTLIIRNRPSGASS